MAALGVAAVEAYTLPLGAVLFTGGLLRRRRMPGTGSWAAFGVPLGVLLLPSVPPAVAGDGAVRPALLGVAAIATLLAGARFRLQAPLAAGLAVVTTLALVHLLPRLAPVYDAVPRWAVLAGAGALLIAIGVGYERRLRDLRRLGRVVRRLD